MIADKSPAGRTRPMQSNGGAEGQRGAGEWPQKRVKVSIFIDPSHPSHGYKIGTEKKEAHIFAATTTHAPGLPCLPLPHCSIAPCLMGLPNAIMQYAKKSQKKLVFGSLPNTKLLAALRVMDHNVLNVASLIRTRGEEKKGIFGNQPYLSAFYFNQDRTPNDFPRRIIIITYLAASAQKLLLDNQGPRGHDPRLVQVLDHDNVVHGLGPQHRRKRLLETGLGDLAHDGQACQAIVESWNDWLCFVDEWGR